VSLRPAHHASTTLGWNTRAAVPTTSGGARTTHTNQDNTRAASARLQSIWDFQHFFASPVFNGPYAITWMEKVMLISRLTPREDMLILPASRAPRMLFDNSRCWHIFLEVPSSVCVLSACKGKGAKAEHRGATHSSRVRPRSIFL
jgi:hypothetical protein